jgi:hypothetical protein
MMNKNTFYRFIYKRKQLFFLMLTAWVVQVQAHLMPAQQGTVNIVGNDVFTVLAVPVSLVPEADDNQDGRLSEAEVHAHAARLRDVVQTRFVLRHGDEAGQVLLLNPMSEPEAHLPGQANPPPSGAGSAHFLVMQRTRFASPPTQLSLSTDLFGTRDGEDQLTLKASQGDKVDVVVLTPLRSGYTFFQSAPQVLQSYVLTGIEHIVLGADHVLFLLTVIVAGLGSRYWLWVLTSFTIAHSLTLVAGLLGWVQVPASIVEPLIAASIVWMAALNLWRAYRVRTHTANTTMPSLKLQIGMVFACGLLHGLGFASSMDGMGLHGTHLIASLVGFNVGIELGQVAVLAATLVLMQLGTKMHQMLRPAATGVSNAPSSTSTLTTPLQSPILISGLALVLGMVWMVERLSGG